MDSGDKLPDIIERHTTITEEGNKKFDLANALRDLEQKMAELKVDNIDLKKQLEFMRNFSSPSSKPNLILPS